MTGVAKEWSYRVVALGRGVVVVRSAVRLQRSHAPTGPRPAPDHGSRRTAKGCMTKSPEVLLADRPPEQVALRLRRGRCPRHPAHGRAPRGRLDAGRSRDDPPDVVRPGQATAPDRTCGGPADRSHVPAAERLEIGGRGSCGVDDSQIFSHQDALGSIEETLHGPLSSPKKVVPRASRQSNLRTDPEPLDGLVHAVVSLRLGETLEKIIDRVWQVKPFSTVSKSKPGLMWEKYRQIPSTAERQVFVQKYLAAETRTSAKGRDDNG
jgi:hypothetical protein